MHALIRTTNLLLLFIGVTSIQKMVLAEVLRVPEQFPTIQSALDSTLPGDTVLVVPGTYREFLVGPNHNFTISGAFQPDIVEEEFWSILDPMPLPDADTPSAFLVTSDSAWIRDFVFRNGPEMRQRDMATRSGGIRNEARMLSVEHCRFDSVSSAIDHGSDIRISNSIFAGCLLHCIWPNNQGRIQLLNCSLSGSGQVLVLGYDHSIVENCIFTGSPNGHFMGLFGESLRVTGCRFDSCSSSASLFYIWPFEESLISRCTFSHIYDVQPVFEVNLRCEIDGPNPIVITECTFEDYAVGPPQAGTVAVQLWCQQGEGKAGEITNCLFQNGYAPNLPGTAISVSGTAYLRDNIFDQLTPETQPDVYGTSTTSPGSIVARNNEFLPPGLAVQTDSILIDARGNWWGDSTGPYNATWNLEGQGTEVGNGVEFIPWLASPPDSLPDTTGTGVDERNEWPDEFSLDVFPNPFNPTTTISFSLIETGLVKLELFDVLGRHVATLTDGVLGAGQHELCFDGSDFASGVYLARLSTPRASQTAKLLLLK